MAIPEYNSTPWSLPVGCYSIIVRHDAIVRRFPGGVRAFEQAYRPSRKSWVLYLLTALTAEDLGGVLERLKEEGLEPGRHLAVADTLRRPVLECRGVAFRDHGQHHRTVDFQCEQEAALPAAELGGQSTHCGPRGALHTSVVRLTRKADRRRFLADLRKAVVTPGLVKEVISREPVGYSSIDIRRPDLCALITLAYPKRGAVPLVHWYGAQRDLRVVRGAWSDVNPFHHRKATSFPRDLNEVISNLVVGFEAAKDLTAFVPEYQS